MKYGVGLVSLLLGVALILWLFAGPLGQGGQSYLGAVAQQRKFAMGQANTWGGKSADGSERAVDSITFDMLDKNGSIDAINILTVRIGGSMQVKYGIMPGDEIIEVGPLPVRGGALMSDIDSAKAFLHDAYARDMKLKVRRAGVEVVLPTADFVPPPFIPLPPSTQPVEDEIEEQQTEPGLLQRIRRVPTH
jgi:hypothetical protein